MSQPSCGADATRGDGTQRAGFSCQLSPACLRFLVTEKAGRRGQPTGLACDTRHSPATPQSLVLFPCLAEVGDIWGVRGRYRLMWSQWSSEAE